MKLMTALNNHPDDDDDATDDVPDDHSTSDVGRGDAQVDAGHEAVLNDDFPARSSSRVNE